jgi:hypothetical protein
VRTLPKWWQVWWTYSLCIGSSSVCNSPAFFASCAGPRGRYSRGFLSGVALLLILIPVTNVNRKTLARRALLVRGDAADTSQAATVEGDRKRVLQPLCGPASSASRFTAGAFGFFILSQLRERPF